MSRNNSIESILKLERLVFDKIEFNRTGFKNDNEIEFQFQTGISQKTDGNIFRVNLVMKGNKSGEYIIEVSLTGFFSFETSESVDGNVKEELLSKNAVAILMPYLRSQITLLTAQPEVDSVILPVFNINNMMEGNDD